MRSNPCAERIFQMLNLRFGGRPRIMHGPHDLKFLPNENNDEGCVVFTPDKQAYFLQRTDDTDEVVDFYEQVGRLRGDELRRARGN